MKHAKKDLKSKAAGEKDEDFDGPVSGGVTDEMLLKTAKNIGSEKAKMDKHRSEIGQFYKQFEEDGGHKKALKTALMIDSMEVESAQDYLRSLTRYMEILGVTDRVMGQEDMFDGKAKMPPAPALPAAASAH